nr:reverse transcriptase domain-containing protein [Tanacetum cinerariifolium]
MLKRCKDTNLCLNWEKSQFMVKEGIVLDHKISKQGIEVDKAKVDVITKLPHPTTVKGIRSFLGHAGFYRRFFKDFSKIARPMTRLLEKDTPFIFSKECVERLCYWCSPRSDFAIGAVLGQHQDKHFRPIHYATRPMTRILKKDTPFIFSKECVEAFQTLKRKLTEAPILIASDWDMPFELMCDASDFAIGAVLGQR